MLIRTKYWFGICLIFAWAPVVSGQASLASAPGAYEIRLKSRQFTPTPMTVSALRTLTGPRHYLIQWDQPLSESVVEKLSEKGVRVASYIPGNTVAAFVPEGFDPGAVPDIRWMGELTARDKLSSRVLNEQGPRKLLVYLHGTADVDKSRTAIEASGGELLSPIAYRPTIILVRGDRGVAEAVAGLDEVSYVYGAPERMTSKDLSRVCAGAMTPIGPVAEFATNGNGWDGPGLGSASLLYHFVNGTPDVTGEEAEVEAALDLWAKYAAITWSETVVPNMLRSVDISWASGNHGDGVSSAFDGTGGVAAHCFLPDPPVADPRAGDLHFDEAESWRIGSDLDIFSIALHEIGHGLGLLHSDVDSVVMAPIHFGPVSDLRQDDIDGIRSLYAKRVETRTDPPVFVPASGTYPSPLEVRLEFSGSSTIANTRISYTLDGSEPTPHSFEFVPGNGYIFQRYSNTIRARAFREGRVPSPIVEADYILTTVTLQVADPVITPGDGNYIDSVVATISTTTPNASIRYTTTGLEPTETSASYTGPLTFKNYTPLRVRAFRSGYAPSQIVSAVYFVTNSIVPPTFNPAGGAFSEPVYVTMYSSLPGAAIRYTTNGSTPSITSPLYTNPVPVNTTGTVKARAFVGASISATAEAAFVIAVQAAIPTITPNGGSYSGTVEVTLASSTPGATIRYTTNNTDPNTNSTLYTGPFTLGIGSYTVRARAYLDGIAPSAAAAAFFQGFSAQVATTETPTVTPFNGQIFVNGFIMTMDCATEGAVIRYSVGTNIVPADPTETGPGGITYTGPFNWTGIGNTWFFKVRAFRTGRTASQIVQTGGLQVVAPLGTVEMPTISPNGGVFDNPVQVTLATATAFGQIAYTDDGTDPSTVLPISLPSRTYASPFTLNSSKAITAKGYRSFFQESGAAGASFLFKCATPVITPPGGDLIDTVVVHITTATTGGDTKIRYTLDGSLPTATSADYTGPFSLSLGGHTVRARAFRSEFQTSESAATEYVVAPKSVPPTILKVPEDQVVQEGGTATFRVTAGGVPPPTYQWQRNDVALPGETDSVLSLVNVQSGDAGKYRVHVSSASRSVLSSVAVLRVIPVTGVRQIEASAVPTAYAMYGNYPNPFNPTTVIRYALPERAEVTLKIFDLLGREVATLQQGVLGAGYFESNWDARGKASGMYVCRIEARSITGQKEGYVRSLKLLLMK